MKADRIGNLDDLAFEGRNKDYGAYYMRRKYPRNLLIATITGVVLLVMIVFAYLLSYFSEPVPLIEGDLMYDVEYYTMSPPPDDELSKLAHALTKLPEKPDLAPVVADSAVKEEPPKEKEETKKDDEMAKTDTIAQPGGSGMGTGTGDDTGLAGAVDVHPRFPGGDQARLYFLRQRVRYPESAIKNSIQGIVMVTFIVEVDGSISNVEVKNKIGGGLDEEAIRVAKEMPRWDPGKRNGKAVRVIVRMPIIFKIPGKSRTS